MKNTLEDLNNYLFAQIERLDDEELTDEQMTKEIKRAQAIQSIGSTIIDGAKVALDASKLCAEYSGRNNVHIPSMIEHKK